MAKRWVSLLGHTVTGLVARRGAVVDPEVDPQYQVSDGGFYPLALLGELHYTNRVFLAGREDRLRELRGLAVRGVRWAVSFRPCATLLVGEDSALARSLSPGNPGAQWLFNNVGFALNSVVVGVPIDVDGLGTRFTLGGEFGLPYTEVSGSITRWRGVPAGWRYNREGTPSSTGTGTALATPVIGSEDFAASGSYAVETQWDAPVGLVRSVPSLGDAGSWVDWPGGIVFVDAEGVVGPRPVSAAFTQLELLVSEKPTWRVLSMEVITRKGDVHQISGRVFYPEEDEPLAGIGVRVGMRDGRVELRAGGSGPWLASVDTTTDSDGNFTVYYRGTVVGGEQLNIGLTPSNDGIDYSRLFSPRFANRVQDLLVIDDAPTENPDGSVCVITPEVPGVPSVPSRFEVLPTLGWDAGANSVHEEEGDCYVSWQMGQVVGVVCGFAHSRDDVEDYNRVTHGFVFTLSGNGFPAFDIIESGRTVGLSRQYAPSDQFEIRRIGREVFYLHGEGNVIYASHYPSEGTVIVGCSLYATGDQIP